MLLEKLLKDLYEVLSEGLLVDKLGKKVEIGKSSIFKKTLKNTFDVEK